MNYGKLINITTCQPTKVVFYLEMQILQLLFLESIKQVISELQKKRLFYFKNIAPTEKMTIMSSRKIQGICNRLNHTDYLICFKYMYQTEHEKAMGLCHPQMGGTQFLGEWEKKTTIIFLKIWITFMHSEYMQCVYHVNISREEEVIRENL